MGRLIDLVKPAQAILPEVTPPEGGRNARVSLDTKLFWTFAALAIYLVCSHIPLYGIPQATGGDPFYLMRMILASSKGSLMELGTAPIITSGMIMQLLSGAKIINVQLDIKEDRQLFNAASKLLGIIITVGQALAYVLSGMYGDVRSLGAVTAILLIVQLTFSGVIVLTLDDVLSKGWGLGAGLNLFMVTNICESIVWRALSPINLSGAFEGIFPALVHALFTAPTTLLKVALRDDGPNLLNLAATVGVFVIVVYIQGFKRDIPLTPKAGAGPRGIEQTYPIKLFYTSNMPIILLSALISNLYFFSQILYRRYPANILINLLGRWSDDPRTGGNRPVGGIAYYVSPPQSLTDAVMDPFHALFYIVFMLSACALFAKTWVELSGSGPADVARQIDNGGLAIKNEKDARRYLSKIIPTAAAFGGMCVAALSIFADLLGAIGSGTGILMAVTIIYELYEKLQKEIKEEVEATGGTKSWLAPFVQMKQRVA